MGLFFIQLLLEKPFVWISPTPIVCKANGGIVEDGICKALWTDTEKICNVSGGRVPKIKEFERMIRNCGGKMSEDVVQWERNKNNSDYQSCYLKKGFPARWYWTDTAYKGGSNHMTLIHLESAVPTWGAMIELRSSLICVKEVK